MTEADSLSPGKQTVSNQSLRNAGLVSGFFVFALGAVGFLGWIFGWKALVEIFPGFPPMSFPTAVAFLLLGLGLFLGAAHRRIGEAIAGLAVAVIGVLFSAPFADLGFFAVARWFEGGALADLAGSGGSRAEFSVLALLGVGLFLACFPYHWRRALLMRVILGLIALALITFEMVLYAGSIGVYVSGADTGTAMAIHVGFGLFVASIGFLGHALESSPRVRFLERLGLSTRLAVLVVLSVLLISGMLWGMAFFAFNRSLVENDLQSIRFDVRLLENRLAIQHRVLEEDLLLMADSFDLGDGFARAGFEREPDSARLDEKEALLRAFLERKPAYFEIGLSSLESGADLNFVYSREDREIVSRPFDRLVQELWRKTLSDGQVGEVVFSLRPREVGISGDDESLIVTASMILDGRTMIFASMDLGEVLRRVEERFTSSGKIVILDANSWVLFGATAFGPRAGMLADRTLFSVLPEARRNEALEELGEIYQFSMDGEYRGLMVRSFFPLGTVESFLFRIGIVDDLSRAAAQSAVVRGQTLILGIPLLVGISLVVFFLVRSVTQPLKDLTEAAEAFGRTGQLSPLPAEGRDEIGQLAHTFGEMVERVRERNDQLNAEIQRRVEWEQERTILIEDLEAKNRELAQVVYIASHDLRSPLVNIQGFSQEISLGCAEIARVMKEAQTLEELREGLYRVVGEDLPESLDYIGTSARKMDMLLKGLLKVSRIGTAELHLAPQDMQRLLDEVVQNFEYRLQETEGRIEVGLTPSVYGDATQLNQVFSNLIENAFNYAHPERKPLISINGEIKNSKQVVYRVRDNGVGIPESHQARIFALFQRLNPLRSEGEGLGLTIVRRILQRHGGAVTVSSEPGQWTEFTLSFRSHAFSSEDGLGGGDDPPAA